MREQFALPSEPDRTRRRGITSHIECGTIESTGSTNAGRIVGSTASQPLKRAHLELGGNNALIVVPGADLALAASVGAFGSFVHQGQTCMTTGRHLVRAALHDAYVEALARKPISSASAIPRPGRLP